MPETKDRVLIQGFAIAYQASIARAGGSYDTAMSLQPSMIQSSDIPDELWGPILELIDQLERRKWGLPERRNNDH